MSKCFDLRNHTHCIQPKMRYIFNAGILSFIMNALVSNMEFNNSMNWAKKNLEILALQTKLGSSLIYHLNLVNDLGTKIVTRFELIKVKIFDQNMWLPSSISRQIKQTSKQASKEVPPFNFHAVAQMSCIAMLYSFIDL